MILTNTPPEDKHKLRINYIIDFDKFIHQAYIQLAKNIFSNPFLYYHKYTHHEIKRNQLEALNTIKTSIIDSIRIILPMELILKNI